VSTGAPALPILPVPDVVSTRALSVPSVEPGLALPAITLPDVHVTLPPIPPTLP
jgi:hypothetical protein